MLRPDAPRTLEVGHNEMPADGAGTDVLFPVPHLGKETINASATKSILKITLAFGGYVVVLRLLGLAYPDLAYVLSKAIAVIFALTLFVAWMSPGEGKKEWPVWVGAFLLVLTFSHYVFPELAKYGLGIDTTVPSLIPVLLQLTIGTLIVMTLLAPVVRTLLLQQSVDQSALGIIGTFEGASLALDWYIPESDFGAWTIWPITLALVLFYVIIPITDQYVRFQNAMRFHDTRGVQVLLPWRWILRLGFSPRLLRWMSRYGLFFDMAAPAVLLISVWVGNYFFLALLNYPYANVVGIGVFVAVLICVTLIRSGLEDALGPYRAAWDALCFWLTYNRQRMYVPQVFQCRLIFREPMVRTAVVGLPIGMMALFLLHMAGIHAAPGSNKMSPEEAMPFPWRSMLPQAHPGLLSKGKLPEAASAVYARHSEVVAERGDIVRLQAPRASITTLLVDVLLAVCGAPILFFILLATTQGNFIASYLREPAATDSE